MKYRIQNINGTIFNAGTDNPSWFSLDKARSLVNYEMYHFCSDDGYNTMRSCYNIEVSFEGV